MSLSPQRQLKPCLTKYLEILLITEHADKYLRMKPQALTHRGRGLATSRNRLVVKTRFLGHPIYRGMSEREEFRAFTTQSILLTLTIPIPLLARESVRVEIADGD